MKKTYHTGFTLIEVLVVVLIIAVLAAVAVPQYQKAVLKSRFSSLLPTTKAVRDGNEAYYLTHSGYASATNQLDVTATDNDDMTLELGNSLDYAYVLATRPSLNNKNNLIMYQKHSINFPGEIHCEADKDDTRANWLCQEGLKGTITSGSITPDFITYVLDGEGNGSFPPLGPDTSNIQDWVMADWVEFMISDIKDLWTNECGNSLSCLQDVVDTTCADNGTGICLNEKGKKIVGSDGHTYYWNTRNNHLAFMFNDYAAKPFFGYVEFLTDGTMHLVGNKNHDASKIIEMCEAVGSTVVSNGDWRTCRL